MTLTQSDPDHVVVLDCNIYLRTAELLQGNYGLDALRLKIRDEGGSASRSHEAASTLLTCYTGKFGPQERIAVFTSDHIVNTTRYIAELSENAGPSSGLGLTTRASACFVDALITKVQVDSGGICYSSSSHSVSDNPPLDYEDGRVYGLCTKLAGLYPLSKVWCVTLDKDFIAESAGLSRAGEVHVVTPSQFMAAVRAKAFSALPPRLRPS